MNRDEIVNRLSKLFDDYFNEVDPSEVDTDDLAESIVGCMERADIISPER